MDRKHRRSFAATMCASTRLASVDKGTHARRTFRPAFRGVIVLDLRQQACVLCLAKNAPERPAGLRVFPEHERQPARQTRQMGCRPSTRITQPAAVQARVNHVCPCQLTLLKAKKPSNELRYRKRGRRFYTSASFLLLGNGQRNTNPNAVMRISPSPYCVRITLLWWT